MVGLDKLFTDKATVVIRVNTKNATTKREEYTEQNLYTNIPCRLSFNKNKNNNLTLEENNIGFMDKQNIKLFLSNSYDIPNGSKIVVDRTGKSYIRSGESAVYSTHQEINLELFQEWV